MNDDSIPSQTPRRRQRRPPSKRLGLTPAKWRELAAILLLIPWVWNDLLDAHSVAKLILLGATLALAQGIVCSFWGVNHKSIGTWLISLIPIAALIWENSKPETKPHPHFKFSLYSEAMHYSQETNGVVSFETIGGSADSIVELTNKFLFNTGPNFIPEGALVLPFKNGRPVASISLLVVNDSAINAEDVEVAVAVSKDFECHFDEHWANSLLPLSSTVYLGRDSRSEQMNGRIWDDFNLLPGNGRLSPPLFISQTNFGKEIHWPTMHLLVRAKDSPAENLAFILTFADIPTNGSTPFRKPFVVTMTMDTNGDQFLNFSEQAFEQSQK